MLKENLDSIKEKLRQAGVTNVYSAFDALPVEKKGEVFTVVGIGAFETSKPVYSQFNVYLPFKTEIEVTSQRRGICQWLPSTIITAMRSSLCLQV